MMIMNKNDPPVSLSCKETSKKEKIIKIQERNDFLNCLAQVGQVGQVVQILYSFLIKKKRFLYFIY